MRLFMEINTGGLLFSDNVEEVDGVFKLTDDGTVEERYYEVKEPIRKAIFIEWCKQEQLDPNSNQVLEQFLKKIGE